MLNSNHAAWIVVVQSNSSNYCFGK